MNNAVGLLHEEMRRAGSLVMRAGRRAQAAGGRSAGGGPGRIFRKRVTAALASPSARHHRPRGNGHRTAASRMGTGDRGHRPPHLRQVSAPPSPRPPAKTHLAFFDAIAPIVHRDSIDFDIAWFQSRYDKKGPGGGDADYINLPLDQAQYRGFVAALLAGEKTDFKEWEKSTPYFEACLPIEVMAARGEDTLRFGPMKPVGLSDPRTGIAALCRGAAAPGQSAGHACGTWWASRPSSNMASRPASSAPFRGWRKPNSPGWAGCTATPSSIRRACWTAELRLKTQPASALRRPDHRRGRLCRKRRHRAAGGPLRRRGSAGQRLRPPPPDHRFRRAAGAYHRRRRSPTPSSP